MNPLLDFSQIYERAIQNQNSSYTAQSIGCVYDISKPVHRKNLNNYIMELKLIDQTLNSTVQSNHLIKYLSVFLIYQKQQDFQLSSKIGDFIYLHKFTFCISNGTKLISKYQSSLQSLYQIHFDQKQDNISFSYVKKLGIQSSSISAQSVSFRIASLKQWMMINFRNVFNPFLGVRIINNFCSLIQPFSMILKVSQRLKNQYEQLLEVQDKQQNKFYINLKEEGLNTNVIYGNAQWIYLRRIKNIGTNFQIKFGETGNVLKLPQIYDQQYEKVSNYQALYRKASKIGVQKKEDRNLTYISVSEQKACTIIQLFELQDKYKSTSKKDDLVLPNHYIVKGIVVKFTGKIQLYHTDYQMIVDYDYLSQLSQKQKKQVLGDNKLIYVFSGCLFLMDRSITSKRELLKIRLFTNDLKSSFFDKREMDGLTDSICDSYQQQKIERVKKTITNKLSKLVQLSSFQNPATLVIEPIRSDELIFRLVNTKIL